MDRDLRQALIDGLLDVPGVRTDARVREQLLADLPDRLRDSFAWSNNPLVDVAALVDLADQWNALGLLIDNVVFLAPGVEATQHVEALRPRLGIRAASTFVPLLQPPRPPEPWAERPEFASLKAALLAGGLVALSTAGRGGLGKTALAQKLGWDPEIRAAYPDGVFWVALGPTPDVLSALANLAAALGGDVTGHADEEARAATVQALLANKRCLLLVDDVWDAAVAARFHSLGATAALLTTRDYSVARVFAARHTTALAQLTPATSVALLHELVTHPMDDRVLSRVAALAGGLPLTLRLLAPLLDDEARMGWGLDAFLVQVEDPTWRGQLLDALVSQSLDALPSEDHPAFGQLAVFGARPATFDLPAVAAIWDLDEGKARDRLRRFVARHLVDPEGIGRFTLHQSVADVATMHLPIDDLAHQHHKTYYLALIERDRADWRTINTELDQIRHAWEAAAPDPEQTLAFIKAMQLFYRRHGFWHEAIRWLKEGGLPAVQLLSQDENKGTILNELGWIYNSLGEHNQALLYLAQALSIRQTVGDRLGQGRTLDYMGRAYIALQQYEQSLHYLEQALVVQESINDMIGLSHTLDDIGRVYSALGEFQKALSYCEQAMQIQQTIGDQSGLAKTLNGIGRVYRAWGKPQQALNYFKEALTIRESLGARGGLHNILYNMAMAYRDLGDLEEAERLVTQAIAINQALGHTDIEIDRAALEQIHAEQAAQKPSS